MCDLNLLHSVFLSKNLGELYCKSRHLTRQMYAIQIPKDCNWHIDCAVWKASPCNPKVH